MIFKKPEVISFHILVFDNFMTFLFGNAVIFLAI